MNDRRGEVTFGCPICGMVDGPNSGHTHGVTATPAEQLVPNWRALYQQSQLKLLAIREYLDSNNRRTVEKAVLREILER